MREVAEITSETPKSRVPQKYKKTKKGRGLENSFPKTPSKSASTAFKTADEPYQLLSDPNAEGCLLTISIVRLEELIAASKIECRFSQK